MDKVKVQVRFERYYYECACGEAFVVDDNKRTYGCPQCGRKLGEGQYRDVGDSIYFDYDKYQSAPPEEIEKEINVRVEQHIYNVKHPPIPVEPTLEMLQEEINNKTQEIQQLEGRKVEMQTRRFERVIGER